MKKILIVLLASTMCCHAQISLVNLTTNQTVGGTAIVGDTLAVAFTKINNAITYLSTNASSGGSATLPTNVVYSVNRVQAFVTNNAYWAASNFLARIPGLYSWNMSGGNDGGNPPFNLPVSLVGSFTGTNAWFPITNGFWTSNTISVALITNGNAGDAQFLDGGHQVSSGYASLTTLNDWSHTGQLGVAVGLQSLASTAYVDAAVENVAACFPAYTGTNGVYHSVYTVAGQAVFDTAQTTTWAPILWTGIDGTGTNFLMTTLQTNLAGGFQLQSNTNLTLIYNWQTITNYSTNIVSGTNTFSIPVNMSLPAQFFRIIVAQSSTFTINPVTLFASGTMYPSNTWNLATITNALPNFGFWQGNSNGKALVSVYLSNGVARIKQLAP